MNLYNVSSPDKVVELPEMENVITTLLDTIHYG